MSVFKTYKTDHAIKMLFISTFVFSLSCFTSFYSLQVNAESKPENTKGQVMHQRALLAPCPSSPNCVNSQVTGDEKHFIKALQLKNVGLENNRNKLLEVLNTFPRVTIITVKDNYIKAEFTSKFFSFVDDVEFVIAESHIDVRSSSRKGYSDMGVNRKRVEEIRSLLK